MCFIYYNVYAQWSIDHSRSNNYGTTRIEFELLFLSEFKQHSTNNPVSSALDTYISFIQ